MSITHLTLMDLDEEDLAYARQVVEKARGVLKEMQTQDIAKGAKKHVHITGKNHNFSGHHGLD